MSFNYATGTEKTFNKGIGNITIGLFSVEKELMIFNFLVFLFIVYGSKMHWELFLAIPICLFLHFVFKAMYRTDPNQTKIFFANIGYIHKDRQILFAQVSVSGIEKAFLPASLPGKKKSINKSVWSKVVSKTFNKKEEGVISVKNK